MSVAVDDRDPDVAAVLAALKAGIDAYRAHDITYVGNRTEDAWAMPAGRPSSRGHEEIRAWRRLRHSTHAVDIDYEVEEVTILPGGEWAFLVGIFILTGAPLDGGEPLEHSGRWLAIWRKGADGVWRMHRDMDSPSPDALRLRQGGIGGRQRARGRIHANAE